MKKFLFFIRILMIFSSFMFGGTFLGWAFFADTNQFLGLILGITLFYSFIDNLKGAEELILDIKDKN